MFDTTRKYKLSIRDQLRMSSVDRWQIMKVDRGQNVAEHTCNVMLISMEILKKYQPRLDNSFGAQIASILMQGLYHDLPEVMTGDIPTPMKKAMSPEALQNIKDIEGCFEPCGPASSGGFVSTIIKCADLIDAIHFLTFNGRDTHSGSVLRDLHERLSYFINVEMQQTPELAKAVESVCHEALNGKQTFMEDLV